MIHEEMIISQMNDYLHKAAKALAQWLNVMLPKSGEDWWNECVLMNLSFNQRELAEEKKMTSLEEFDLAALLRIADKSWYTMRGYAYLPTRERDVIRDMYTVRNNWAHLSAELPSREIIVADIEKLIRFFDQLNQHALSVNLENLKKQIVKSNTLEEQKPVSAEQTNLTAVSPLKQAENTIKEKSLVYIVGDPNTKGIVFSVSALSGTNVYQVFVDGTFKTFYEGQIALVDTREEIEWVSSETLRSYLTAYQINNPSAENLYSLNSARIDFVPYQFRPALKLIKADEPRILIADSVGVGKTIEAGLIIRELQARSDIENILIICPKPLVADRKWESEMKRFDEDFIPLDGNTLHQIIADTDRDGEWPSRYGKLIIPYSILDSKTYAGNTQKKFSSPGLVDLDPPPHFDLVIIDEAHHLRNGSMEKEKAFAYKCVKYFCDHSDAVVMLTATPLQLDDNDLFTLLNVLRPDIFLDKKSFNMMAQPNPYISECAHIIRAAKPGWKTEALNSLNSILTTQWGESIISGNPLYDQVRNVLKQERITREERVKLITDIESLHTFNAMMNRTRRKDIQDFCIRRPFTIESSFTDQQRELHDSLLAFEIAALSKLHGGKGIKFMISTIRRQASSCIFGLAPHIRDIISRRFTQLEDDPDFDVEQSSLADLDTNTFQSIAKHILDLADNLSSEDPKFEGVLQIIREKQNADNNKIILFSTFRYTLVYLQNKLEKAGIRAAQIDGSVNNDTRLDLRCRFELPKSDPDAIDVLLFTEVGSEGLDYQFCDTIINYDLPWNPMRIEQRIGRIDRRGQTSEVVNIYNIITRDTIDADIYTRCLSRIGIFEGSIGECEAILGEIGKQIESIALDSQLTDEERKIKLEQMADNEVRKAQELNRLEKEEKELFGFDLSNYTVSKQIQEAESPFLTARSIQHLVDMYLNRKLGRNNYILGDSPLKTLRLSASARAEVLADTRLLSGTRSSLRKKWELYLKGNNPTHSITFDAETAERERNAFFITSVHPLVKQAAAFLASNNLVYIHLEYYSDEIPAGDYLMAIYAWNYVGIRSSFKLVTICEEPRIENELPDYILTANSVNYNSEADSKKWDALEEKHIQKWQNEKKLHIESTKQLAAYKQGSIKNNYLNRRLILERKIEEDDDERIRTMHKYELENATSRYNHRVEEIEAQIAKADIHTSLIAKGIITVKR